MLYLHDVDNVLLSTRFESNMKAFDECLKEHSALGWKLVQVIRLEDQAYLFFIKEVGDDYPFYKDEKDEKGKEVGESE